MGSKPNIFISYSYHDRFIAGDIKTELESIGFVVFMAHEDIEPSEEWQNEIIRQLTICDVFIPLFSKNFRESKWTDQETGIAFGSKKEVIPISLDKTMPYGFIGKYQTLRCKDDITETCSHLFKTLFKKPIAEILKKYLINSLGSSENYITSISIGKKLALCEPYSILQVNEMIYWFLMNDQVSGATPVKNLITPLIEKNEKAINPLLIKLYNDFKNNNWQPKHRINGHEEILKLLMDDPTLTRDNFNQTIEEVKKRDSISTFEVLINMMENKEIPFDLYSIWRSRNGDSSINMNNLAKENLTLREKIHALLTVAGGQSIREISTRSGVDYSVIEAKLEEMLERGEILDNKRVKPRLFEVS